MTSKQQRARQQWLADFERKVVERSPAHAGKLNWDAAIHMFNTGVPIDEAVERFIASEQPVERKW